MTEQDYRRLFDRVAPGPELVERTIKAAEGGVRPRRRAPLRRLAALMLTAGCCIFLPAAARQASPLPDLHFPPLEVGDVILRQGIGLDSMVIAKVSDSVYSHVGMVAAVNPEITIIHAAVDDRPDKANQVIASSLPFFVSKARRIAVKRYPLSAEERARAAQSEN